MPKLSGYFGLRVYFYASDHEPVHVHGFYQGRESKAELIIVNGVVGDSDRVGGRNASAHGPVAGGF